MGIFTTALRNYKIRQNTSPYFHSVLLVIWPLTLMKRAHLSELFISRFSTYIRKAMTVIAQDQWNTKIHYWYFEVFNVHKSLGSLWWRWVPNRHLIIRWRGVRFQTIQISVLVIALLQFAKVGWKICNVRKKCAELLIYSSNLLLCHVLAAVVAVVSWGPLGKPRRRRQRRHGKTKDLIGKTIAQHVHFKTLYIS